MSSKTTTIKQTNHINVVGVKRGSIECPSGTWQRRKGSGNPKDRPVCSNLDPEVCGPGAKSRWANLTRLANGSVVSLDGVVECEFNGETVENDQGTSPGFPAFYKTCFTTTQDCPIDHSNANGNKRDLKMEQCSKFTQGKVTSPEKRTPEQNFCIKRAKDFPNDLAVAISAFCEVPFATTAFGFSDCMCANPEITFLRENYTWPNHKKFWTALELSDKNFLSNRRGAWLKSCNSISYLNSPLITTGGQVVKVCNDLNVFLKDQKEIGNLDAKALSDIQDLSICYTDGKFTGGKGGNVPLTPFSNFFDKYFWYIVAVIVVILVILIIVAYMEKKKKTTKKSKTK